MGRGDRSRSERSRLRAEIGVAYGRGIQRPPLLPRREPRRYQVPGLAGRRVPLRSRYARPQPLACAPDRDGRVPEDGQRRGAQTPQCGCRFAGLRDREGGLLRRRSGPVARRHLRLRRFAGVQRQGHGRRRRTGDRQARKGGHGRRSRRGLRDRPAGKGSFDQGRLLLAQRREVLRTHRRTRQEDGRLQAHPRRDRFGRHLLQRRIDHRRGAGIRPLGRQRLHRPPDGRRADGGRGRPQTALLVLGDLQLLHGDRQVPRGPHALGQHRQGIQPRRSTAPGK